MLKKHHETALLEPPAAYHLASVLNIKIIYHPSYLFFTNVHFMDFYSTAVSPFYFSRKSHII